MDWLNDTVAVTASPEVVNGLIAVSVKAALLLCAALAVTATLRRAPASARHRVLAFALIAVLALPVLTIALPSWQLAILPSALTTGAPAPAAERFGETPSAVNGSEPSAPAPGEIRELPAGTAAQSSLKADPPAAPPAPSTPVAGAGTVSEASAGPADTPITAERAADDGAGAPASGGVADALRVDNPVSWLLALWVAGALFLLARLAMSTAAAWWLARGAEPVTDEDWLRQADAVRRRLGVHHDVRLVRSDRISMPMAWGAFRPTVLLPDAARTWTAERRNVVLLHEMAHLKRRDCQTLLLARLVTALHWVNPLTWTATRLLQAERERACDDLVLRSGTSGADYAQHLLDIARSMSCSRRPSWATVAMARPSELEGRLLAILDTGRARDHGGRAATVVALLVIGMLVLPLAALQPSAMAQEQEIGGSAEGAQKIKTRVVTDIELQHRFDIALQRAFQFQFDLQRQVKTDVKMRLPINVNTAITQGAVQGLAAGLGEGLAEALPAALSQGQESGDINPRVVQAFLTALQDEDPGIRAQAANSLGNIESEEAVGALSELLRNDPEAEVRREAAWALGMIESDEAVGALVDAISDDDADVRSQAVWALGMIESDQAVAGLITALSDSDDDVREQAAWALGMIEDATAVDALATALRSDASPQVRQQAAWALGMIEDESAIEPLLDALTDDNTEVRKTALWAVAQISG